MVSIAHHGSLVLVTPQSDVNEFWDWVDENVGEYQSFGGALVVEPRFVDNLIFGLESGGFVVR